MKAGTFLAGIGIAGAVFVGAFSALQFNKWIESRHETSSIFTQAPPNLLHSVDNATQIGPLADFRAAARKVMPSVVSVDRYERVSTSFFDDVGSVQETGQGSGVIISSDGLIVTNNHVVSDESGQAVSQVKVRTNSKKTYAAKILGRDPRSDLAVIKIDATGLTPIELGVSAETQVGQWAMAVGNPLGFDDTVSVGVVSSLKRSLQVGQGYLLDAIQTDAAINPGNSGGALTDANGHLIGVNSAIASSTGQSVGIGFAIPVDRVKEVANDIVKYGYARYAGLGVRSNPNWHNILQDPQARQELGNITNSTNVPSQGLIVKSPSSDIPSLEPGGAAEKAGIREWNVILSIDGEPVSDVLSLNRVLTPMKPGQVVNVKFWDRGQTKSANVTLEELRESV